MDDGQNVNWKSIDIFFYLYADCKTRTGLLAAPSAVDLFPKSFPCSTAAYLMESSVRGTSKNFLRRFNLKDEDVYRPPFITASGIDMRKQKRCDGQHSYHRCVLFFESYFGCLNFFVCNLCLPSRLEIWPQSPAEKSAANELSYSPFSGKKTGLKNLLKPLHWVCCLAARWLSSSHI